MRIRAHDVIAYTAWRHGLTVEELCSEKRTRRYARARWVAIIVIRELCPHMSLPHIGRLLGGRDHTTILHGLRHGLALREVNDDFALDVEAVMSEFDAAQVDEPGMVHISVPLTTVMEGLVMRMVGEAA